MKQNSNRRSRSRGSNKKNGQRGNNYDSNGPAGRVRGTAQQVLEKYQILGRDAASSGDWIVAESCLQYAEHYYRIVNSEVDMNGKVQQAQGQKNDRDQQAGGGVIATEIPIVESDMLKSELSDNNEPPESLSQKDRSENSEESDHEVVKKAEKENSPSVGSRRRRPRGKLAVPPPVPEISDT